jgi:hypothetical protein
MGIAFSGASGRENFRGKPQGKKAERKKGDISKEL